MKIQVKKIQTMKDHDGGTAFSANVYVDGKLVGHIIEDGWGGGLQINIPNKDGERIEAYLKAQPVIGNGEFHGDIEIYLSGLVYTELDSRELKRKLKKPIAFEKGKEKDGLVGWSCKWGQGRQGKDWDFVLADLKKRNPNHIFLNELPFDEALAIFSPEPEFTK